MKWKKKKLCCDRWKKEEIYALIFTLTVHTHLWYYESGRDRDADNTHTFHQINIYSIFLYTNQINSYTYIIEHDFFSYSTTYSHVLEENRCLFFVSPFKILVSVLTLRKEHRGSGSWDQNAFSTSRNDTHEFILVIKKYARNSCCYFLKALSSTDFIHSFFFAAKKRIRRMIYICTHRY